MGVVDGRRQALLVVSLLACGRSNVYDLDTFGTVQSSGGSVGQTSGRASTGTGSGSPTGGASSSGTEGFGVATSATSGRTDGIGTSGNGTASGGSGGFTTGVSTGRKTTATASTSGSTGSTGGTTSGCLQVPPNEFEVCTSDDQCGCPLHCVPNAELGVSLCLYPCSSLSDCPNLETSCASVACQPNLCGPNFMNGALDGTCSVPGAASGSCIPSTLANQNLGLCSQAGPAVAGCDPSATRSDLGQACIAGDYCAAELGSTCNALCDPFAFQPCGLGAKCVTLSGQDPRLGVCQPAGTTTGTNTGTAGTGTTSSSTSGSGGSSSGTSGCDSTIQPFQSCQTNADCGCLLCVFDSAAAGKVCERACLTSSDCPELVTSCQNGICAVTQCGGATGNGTFNGTCTVASSNDGTCEPLTPDAGLSSIGYCWLAGTGTATSCDPNPNRGTDPSQICAPGSLCFGGFETFGGTCNQLCDPNGGTCQNQNQFCSPIVNEPDLGICISGF